MAKNANNKVGVWQSLRNAWKVEDIRKKLIYTFLMLVVFRLVGVIPAPGVDYARVQAQMGASTLPLLDLVNMMTGSNFQNMTIMAMGITDVYKRQPILITALRKPRPPMAAWASKSGCIRDRSSPNPRKRRSPPIPKEADKLC